MKNRFIKISHVLVLVSSLSLTSVHAQDVTITVDATVNKKTVSPNITGQTEIAVYDMMGRKILNSFVDYNGYSLLSFDISTLERGVYFFSIKNKHDTSTKKFSVIK